ncbi:actin-like protein arp8 [Gonapodya sp. JEL0774]|nr:actin-like protein arp8 [Gonapodya sp. JEL0774]
MKGSAAASTGGLGTHLLVSNRDRDRATGNKVGTLVGSSAEFGGLINAGDADGEFTVVIHPGSRLLRVGRAQDGIPKLVHNVVARRIDTIGLLRSLRLKFGTLSGSLPNFSIEELAKMVGWSESWEDAGDEWYADGVTAGWNDGMSDSKGGVVVEGNNGYGESGYAAGNKKWKESDVQYGSMDVDGPTENEGEPNSPTSNDNPKFPTLSIHHPTYPATLADLHNHLRNRVRDLRASGVQGAQEKVLAANARAETEFTSIPELSDRRAVAWTRWGVGVRADGSVVGDGGARDLSTPTKVGERKDRGPPPDVVVGISALNLPQFSLPHDRDAAFRALHAALISEEPESRLELVPPLYVLRRPIRHGALNATSYASLAHLTGDIEAIWRNAVTEVGVSRRDLKRYNLVLVIPDKCDKLYVQTMVRVAMDLCFPAVLCVQESAAACFGAGFGNGTCVVDVGAEKSSVSCVDEGIVVQSTRINLKYGADDVTWYLSHLLWASHFPHRSFDPYRVLSDFLHVAEHVKETNVNLDFGELISTRNMTVEVRSPGCDARVWTVRWWDEGILAAMVRVYPRFFAGEFSTQDISFQILFYPSIINHYQKLRGLLYPRYFAGGSFPLKVTNDEDDAVVKLSVLPNYPPPSVELLSVDEWVAGVGSQALGGSRSLKEIVEQVRDLARTAKRRKISETRELGVVESKTEDNRLEGVMATSEASHADLATGDELRPERTSSSSNSESHRSAMQTKPLDLLVAAQEPLDVSIARSLLLYHRAMAQSLAAGDPAYIPDPKLSAQVQMPNAEPFPGQPPTPLHPFADELLRRIASTVLLAGDGVQTSRLSETLQDRVQQRLNEMIAVHLPHLYWSVPLVNRDEWELEEAKARAPAENGQQSLTSEFRPGVVTGVEKSIENVTTSLASSTSNGLSNAPKSVSAPGATHARGTERGRGRGSHLKGSRGTSSSANSSKAAGNGGYSSVAKPSVILGPPKVLVIYPPPRDIPPGHLVWKGASVLARLEIAREMWIGRSEFENAGIARVCQVGVRTIMKLEQN